MIWDVFFSLLCVCCNPCLQSDIAALYIKVGVKNIGTVFLHTDAQIPDECFLVLINDMLASGLDTQTGTEITEISALIAVRSNECHFCKNYFWMVSVALRA